MMGSEIFYSESVGGFLDSAIFRDMPEDAVYIPDNEYQALIKGQENGQIIDVENGFPVLRNPPESALIEQAKTDAKQTGAKLAGVMVSLTEENQNGIASVLTGANLAAEVGAPFFPLNFNAVTAAGVQAVPFNNMDELKAFALAFMAARQQFFQ